MAQIIWHGTVFDSSGYAKAAKEYVLALHAAGANVKIEPYPGPTSNVELLPEQRSVLENLVKKTGGTAHQVSVYHSIPELWQKGLRPSFGFTYWETSKIPDNWVEHVCQMHAIFLPSLHNIHVFRNSGVDIPLYYVRPCLSRPYHPPSIKHTPAYVNHLPPFRFLSVCSCIDRKGLDLLLKAFWGEFTIDDPVCLIIKSTHLADVRHLINSWKQELNLSHQTAPVYIDLETRSELEMESLYGSSQVFVLASRGEGISYSVLEAVMRGVPSIVTGWGGHLDFLNEYNSYLIPYQLVPVPRQSYYPGYQPDQLWAEPSIDALRKIMRHVITHYEEALGKAELAKLHTLSHFSPDQAAQDLISALSQITGFNFI